MFQTGEPGWQLTGPSRHSVPITVPSANQNAARQGTGQFYVQFATIKVTLVW